MNRSGLVASVILLIAVTAGLVFWMTRERLIDVRTVQLPPPTDPVRKDSDSAAKSAEFDPIPAAPEPTAFTYVVDGHEHAISMKDYESIRHRLSMYADLDYAEPVGDYDVFEFVLGSYDVRDSGIALTDAEVRADYARLFETDDFEEKLKSYLELNKVSRAEFDFIVRGRVAGRKLLAILGSSGMCSDRETQDEIGAFSTQYNLAYVRFEAASYRANFPGLPPDQVNARAFKQCHDETQRVKDEIKALNDAMCKSQIDAIANEEADLAEKEIVSKGNITPDDAESIRRQHREAATAKADLVKLDNGGKAFDQYTKEKQLVVEETGWFSLPSPLKPVLPANANFFQSHALATRLVKGRFGGVYDDDPTACYLAKKIDERTVEVKPTTAEIIRGRYRWSHRHSFKRELTLRYPALMRKYQCTTVELGTTPGTIAGGPAGGTTRKNPASANLPKGVPDQGEDPSREFDEEKGPPKRTTPSASDSPKEPK
ncbi:MAG: hypothetical protein HYR85_02730 [Planctomycetes bacterium]|nr:hypothetical protein [Planctomycetota bacterium]